MDSGSCLYRDKTFNINKIIPSNKFELFYLLFGTWLIRVHTKQYV